MNKKKVAGGLFFLIFSNSVFAGSIAGKLAEAKPYLFDSPIVSGITYFAGSIENITHVVRTLAILFGVIGCLWTAFKLWFGTEQVKKSIFGLFSRFLLYTAIIVVYPSICNWVMEFPSQLGASIGGGNQMLAANMKVLFDDVQNTFNKSVDTISGQDGYLKKYLSGTTATNKQVKNILSSLDLDCSDEAVEEAKKKYGIKEGNWFSQFKKNSKQSNINYAANLAKNGITDAAALEGYDYNDIPGMSEIDKQIQNNAGSALAANASGKKKELLSQYILDPTDGKYYLINKNDSYFVNMKKMYAMYGFFGGSGKMKAGEKMNDLSLSVYLKSMDGKETGSYLLSPGTMVKMGTLLGYLITNDQFLTVNNVNGEAVIEEESFDFSMKCTFRKICKFLANLLISILLFSMGLYFAISYTITIMEFMIVTLYGYLLLPCILFEGSRSYATRLVQVFVSYFFKLCVMITCVFWAMYRHANMGISWLTSSSDMVFSPVQMIYESVIMLLIVIEAPKVASVLTTGNPSLSMGDFSRLMATGLRNAQTAFRAGKSVASAGGNLAHGVGRVGAGGFSAVSAANTAGSAASKARMEAMSAMKNGDLPMFTPKEIEAGGKEAAKKARTAVYGSIFRENVKSAAATLITGRKYSGAREGNDSDLNIGKGYYGSYADGSRTFGEVNSKAEKVGTAIGKDFPGANNNSTSEQPSLATNSDNKGVRESNVKPNEFKPR